MKSFAALVCAIAFSVSTSALAHHDLYECGKLHNRYGVEDESFKNYFIKVDGDFVILVTTHGSSKGMHSETGSLMNPKPSKTSAKLFEAQGIEASFVDVETGGKSFMSVTIRDRHGRFARCYHQKAS